MNTSLAQPDLAPAIDVMVESAKWEAAPDADAIVRRAIAAAAAMVEGESARARDGEVTVVLADDDAIRKLNREWRGQDKPTNVLSFPAAASLQPGAPVHLGDIVIAYETLAREAAEEGKPFAHHLTHLAVHGFLHLLGYDHDSDRDAETMEALERAVLARLGVPDPYATHEA